MWGDTNVKNVNNEINSTDIQKNCVNRIEKVVYLRIRSGKNYDSLVKIQMIGCNHKNVEIIK